jgi:hypothetical protein
MAELLDAVAMLEFAVDEHLLGFGRRTAAATAAATTSTTTSTASTTAATSAAWSDAWPSRDRAIFKAWMQQFLAYMASPVRLTEVLCVCVCVCVYVCVCELCVCV